MDRREEKALREIGIEARPVLESRTELHYPTRDELLGDSRAPARCWGKAAAGAATFFLAINIAAPASSQALASPPNRPAAAPMSGAADRKPKQGVTVVAPVFNHGEGSGSLGCIVMTPPMFLSEDEAITVIKDELARHGIKLDKGGPLPGVVVEIPFPGFDSRRRSVAPDQPTKKQPLSADAADRRNRVAVQFLTRDDCTKLGAITTYGAVWTYESRKGAERLAKEIAGQGQDAVFLGLFYDPMVPEDQLKFEDQDLNVKDHFRVASDPNATAEERALAHKKIKEAYTKAFQKKREAAAGKSKKLLRQQVQDFAAWLRKQGVELPKKPQTPKAG